MLKKDLFNFLAELKQNNDRDWFQAHKDRYESDVREPLLQFVRDFEPHLEEISPYFLAIAKKSGGALFRIHRDVRFSKDKSPYKTHAALHFRHECAKDVHAPGFYLHLEPKQCFCGAGIWRPDSASLRKIRDAMVEDPKAWKKATGSVKDLLHGDSLKRAPKGFDPEHPLIEDLRRKDHVVMLDLEPKNLLKQDFLQRYVEHCRRFSPYVEYLCKVLGLDF